MDFQHVSVLLWETIEGLNIKPNGIYVDGTAGGAGHSTQIAKKIDPQQGGRLISIDKDPDAIETATERLKPYPAAQVVRGDFKDIPQILDELQIDKVDGIMLDLGVSSRQLDTAERGFSYHFDSRLDMRMSQHGLSANDVVNTYSKEDLDPHSAGLWRRKICTPHCISHCAGTGRKTGGKRPLNWWI